MYARPNTVKNQRQDLCDGGFLRRMTSINTEPQTDVETNAAINGIQTLSRKKQTAFGIPLE